MTQTEAAPEFLYFQPFRNMPPRLQRKARRYLLDVCDQVIYHLIAVKPGMDEAAVRRAEDALVPYVRERLAPRRGRVPETPRTRLLRLLRQAALVLQP